MIQAKINPVPILAMLVLGAALAIVASCGKGMPDPTYGENPEGRLLVDNLTKYRYVLFAGEPRRETYIGGVPANAKQYRLKVGADRRVVSAIRVEHYIQTRDKGVEWIPIQSSYAISNSSSDQRILIVKNNGIASIVFENRRETPVKLDMARAYSSVTNVVYLPGKSVSMHIVDTGDYTFYPFACEQSSMKLVEKCVKYSGVNYDETNRFIIN